MAQNEQFGALKSPYDGRDYTADFQKCELPKSYSQWNGWQIRNQGDTGSCTAQASAYVVESYNMRQEYQTKQMSAGFVYGQRRNYQHTLPGIHIRQALKTLHKYGTPLQAQFPYMCDPPEIIDLVENHWAACIVTGRARRISGYFRLNVDDIVDIKSAIYSGTPVIASIDWLSGYNAPVNGICQNKGDFIYSHAFCIYGWDEHGWKFVNSWGKSYGIGGKATMPYECKLTEAWGITDFVTNTCLIKKGMEHSDMGEIEMLLDVASADIGVKESPAGSNNCPANTWYYGRPVNGSRFAWCVVWVAYCFERAGLGSIWIEGNTKSTAYCPYVEARAKESGQWVTSHYKRGDCVLYNFDKDKLPDHIGIIESVNADGTITAIEGNTSSDDNGSQSNGGMVARRTRKLSVVAGAFRPNYKKGVEETMTEPQLKKFVDDAIEAYMKKTMGLSPSRALADEYEQATQTGITDGSNPRMFATREQVAVMTLRSKTGKSPLLPE